LDLKCTLTVPDGKEVEVGSLLAALTLALGLTPPGATTTVTQTTPTTASATTTEVKRASAKQVAAIHAIYKSLGETDQARKVLAVRNMLGKEYLGSIDDLTPWEASKVITALKEAQANRTNTPPTPPVQKELEPF